VPAIGEGRLPVPSAGVGAGGVDAGARRGQC